MKVQRGDVILTRVPHAAGGRGKKRPAVVVQADRYNQSERHTIVAEIPATSAAQRTRPIF
jgi:mRNA-degrading endonuclease toxin of MazEF toxin-antitoxin module